MKSTTCSFIVFSAILPAALADFPYELPMEKPDIPLSPAMDRLYEQFPGARPEDNELFTNFKYTRLTGFDYHGGDGTISRRDPTKVIRVDGKFHVWYTHRATPNPPRGANLADDTTPSSDWDLAEIWHATSEDGFTWKEEGVAVPRPPKPNAGWRSVSTPDILVWKGKYYLYYQAFMEISGKRGDDCPVSVSIADSPDGPWTATNKIVVENGPEGSWDHYSIHDPYPIVRDGKIYLYYKSDYKRNGDHIRSQGLAIAEDPLGPFVKHPLNPVINSGHETTLFPYREGMAALVIRDGNENNTIQYAPDGVSFKVVAHTILMPNAGGPYVPDAFTDTKDGRGITWGISHFTSQGEKGHDHSILARFDCDLSRDVDSPSMKRTNTFIPADTFFMNGLSGSERKAREGR